MLATQLAHADDFIISFWHGPPAGGDADAQYAEIAECNFTHADRDLRNPTSARLILSESGEEMRLDLPPGEKAVITLPAPLDADSK